MDPQLKALCALLSVFLSTIAFIPYVVETWKVKGSNEVRPTVSGWASWMLSDAAILAAMIASDAISWQMVPYVLGPIVVIGLSLRKGLKLAHMRGETVSWKDAFMDWSRKDTVCVSLVVAAVALWGIKHDPDYAIYLTTFSTIIGTWAVARPLAHDPYRESLLAWSGFLAGALRSRSDTGVERSRCVAADSVCRRAGHDVRSRNAAVSAALRASVMKLATPEMGWPFVCSGSKVSPRSEGGR